MGKDKSTEVKSSVCTQWEYRIEEVHEFVFRDGNMELTPTEQLNNLGKQGWELIGFSNSKMYFKRILGLKYDVNFFPK
jgi:hypothetical protein